MVPVDCDAARSRSRPRSVQLLLISSMLTTTLPHFRFGQRADDSAY